MAVRYFMFLPIFVATTAAAETLFDLQLPGCPFSIQGTLSDLWVSAVESPEVLRTLELNTVRSATYVQAWIKPEQAGETSMLLAGTLGSLEPHQGSLTQKNFEEIASAINKATAAPSKEISDAIRARVDGLTRGSTQSLTIQGFDVTDSFRDDDSVTIVGFAFGTSGREGYVLVSVQRHLFIDGCIATLQFSFPLGRYGYDEVLSLVNGISLAK